MVLCLILLWISCFAQLLNLAILDSSFRKEQQRKNLLDYTCSAYWLGQNNYYPGEGTCKDSVDRIKVVFPKSFTHGN